MISVEACSVMLKWTYFNIKVLNAMFDRKGIVGLFEIVNKDSEKLKLEDCKSPEKTHIARS